MIINNTWMLRMHHTQALDIDARCFADRLSARELKVWTNRRDSVGRVVLDQTTGRVLAFCIYALCVVGSQRSFFLGRLAVHPEEQGLGYARMLVNCLKRKVEVHPKRIIVVEVPEESLEAQKFFRHMGFRAENVDEGFYGEGDVSYRMVWRLEATLSSQLVVDGVF